MPEDKQERLAKDSGSLTGSARQHLASLHGLDAGYAESAIAQLPPGTTALLLAAGALRPGPEGYPPELSSYGQDLIAWLATTEPLVPTAPGIEQPRALYDRVAAGGATAASPADLRLAEEPRSGAPAGAGGIAPATELRDIEALTHRAIGQVLADRGGVLHVHGAGDLLVEPSEDGLDVRDVSAGRSGWSFVTSEGTTLGPEPTRVPVEQDAALPELARTLLGRRRRR